MAPRTREQQDAYNAKRRKAKAADAAPAKTVVRAAKPKPTKAEREAKSAKAAKRLTNALKVHGATDAEIKTVIAKREVLKPKHDVAAQVKTLGADSLLPPQEGSPIQHTMPRSYVRNGGAGMGKLRGKTWQATVSFTAEQMPQVVEAAKFRGVSLAEMIRSCVVEHLNRGVKSPSE